MIRGGHEMSRYPTTEEISHNGYELNGELKIATKGIAEIIKATLAGENKIVLNQVELKSYYPDLDCRQLTLSAHCLATMPDGVTHNVKLKHDDIRNRLVKHLEDKGFRRFAPDFQFEKQGDDILVCIAIEGFPGLLQSNSQRACNLVSTWKEIEPESPEDQINR